MAPEMSEATTFPSGDESPQSRRRFRWWHILVVVLLVLVGVVLGLRWHWKRGFHKRIEAIAAAGYPVTPEELDAWYESPKSGENAADWVMGAATYFRQPPEKEYRELQRIVSYGSNRLGRRVSIPDDMKELLVAHVRDNAKGLELLHRAARIEESRYPIDLSEGLDFLITHIGDVRDAWLLLCFEAVLCGEAGDGEGATRAIEAAFQVAHTLSAEPVLISQLVCFAGQRGASASLERILGRTELNDAQLERLASVVGGADEAAGVPGFLIGVQCQYLEVFRRPEALDPDFFQDLPPREILEAYSALGLAAREGSIFLEMMEQYIEAAQLPTYERLDAVRALETLYRRRAKRSVILRRGEGVRHILIVEIECLACLRATRVGLAVERYRLGTGHWPEALSELVPDYLDSVPEDPFDGAPFRYKRLDRGFVVYSVGKDGVDNDGQERWLRDEGKSGEAYDLTFSVER